MYKIKNRLLTFTNNSYFPFVVLTFFLLFFHACIYIGNGDDLYFQSVLKENSLFEWLIFRYNNWTSRLIIEFFLIIISGHHLLWRLLNVAMMLLGTLSTVKIFSSKRSIVFNWLVCALFLCLPKHLYNSAGWIATTLNYSWVLCLGLFAMIPIKKIISKEKIVWYEYIFYIGAMIYATNSEQMCLILIMVYFFSMCYMFYLDKKLNWFLLTSFIMNFSSLIFIITCPGNVNRNISETATWFPEYGSISLFRKLEIGYSSTLFEFIMKPNLVFLIFAVLLFICVMLKHKSMSYRLISFIPLACNLIFGFLSEFFPEILGIRNSLTHYGTGLGFRPVTWIPDIVLSLVCACIIISLYVSFEHKKMFILTTSILLLGFISRMVMSFSPTIWASLTRTFIFMYTSIIMCSFILYQKISEYKVKMPITFSNFAIFVIFLVNLFNSLSSFIKQF